jgi:FixJ family two-component response regulator
VHDFTVFLVDDNRAVLRALDGLLRAAGYPTKTYSSAKIFLHEHDVSVPGCLVLDLAMPELNGLEVQEAFARQGVTRPIIFLTGQATIPASVQAMKAGAIDFLSKPVNKPELLSAIESAKVRDKNQRDIEVRQDVVLQRISTLTAREKAVLEHVVKGWLNKQIGAALGIGEKTVKVYRGRMLQKMGVRTVPDLVRMTVLVSPRHSLSS